ncbi:MAG: hypothetical protein JXL82_01855 [Candidatus Omnitrophica bacterium]|nr:hypothetical protein [Candidatus Omnitrophota bacterium]
MAEEVKKEGTGGFAADKKILATILKVVLGLVFLVLGAMAILTWWGSLLVIIKGSIGLFLILAGVITLAIAKE